MRRGAYCYVLNARQMGKSSLRVRTMGRLDPGEFACVSIDVSMLGGTRITTDQWYAGICRLLLGGLGLASEVNLRTWWRERVLLTPTQRLLELFDEVILRRVARHIVIFIDEIDSVRSLEFDVDDFFVLIRSLYNLRAEDERFERLTFALFGVASPRELMRGTHRTAINIGRAIPLSPLEFSDAGPLLAGLADKGRDAEAILRSVFSWTGGQPFFTQKLCELLQRDETNPEPGQEAPWVEKLIRREVIHNWELQDEPEHLRTIRDRLLGVGESVPALLHLYLDVYADREVTVDEELQELLLLTGLVVRAGHKLQVSNRIYREVFDHGWIEEQLARYATRTGGPQPGSEE